MATAGPTPEQKSFRIDVSVHDLLMAPNPNPAQPAENKGLTLPEPVFPQHPELLKQAGPTVPPEKRHWDTQRIKRTARGWLVPYLRSRLLPGDFHPITSYLFTDYKCNVDCWYCWAYNNKTKGMTEDVARRSIDWIHDHGGRVLGIMGGEPLIRPQFVHKVVDYAAKKGFWIYIGTNGRLLKPDVVDRLGDAGVAVYNFAIDSFEEKQGLPKSLKPVEKQLEYLWAKQYVYGYMVFFNINICRNNTEDVRQITEWAHERRIATDYHINETPMLEQSDGHFKHLHDNPTYIWPEDWRNIDAVVDWLIEKNKAGYQMVNSIARLQEMKAFMRMSSGVDLREVGWYGDGTGIGDELDLILSRTPGIERTFDGRIQFAEWNCRGGQNNVIIRPDGTIAPCFPLYPSTVNWGNIDEHHLDRNQLHEMKQTCQRHCFSTLNHNLAYCYNDARVLKWVWQQAKNGFQGGARSFED